MPRVQNHTGSSRSSDAGARHVENVTCDELGEEIELASGETAGSARSRDQQQRRPCPVVENSAGISLSKQ